MENEFRIWLDQKTAGFSRSQRRKYKDEFAELVGISTYVIEHWISGTTKPTALQKAGINAKIGETVFKID